MSAAQTLQALAAMTPADWAKVRTVQEAVRSVQEPECPFCGEPFEVTRQDGGMAWGVCYQCAEPVAVNVYGEANEH